MQPDVLSEQQTAIEHGPRLTRAFIGGLFGTVLMTALMYLAAPFVLGQPMDVAAMLANALGIPWSFGMTLHFVNGTLIFPFLYMMAVYPALSGPPVARGMTWGVTLWLLSQAIVMPVLGAGFFSSQAGGVLAVTASLLAHLVYGASLGAVASDPDGPLPV